MTIDEAALPAAVPPAEGTPPTANGVSPPTAGEEVWVPGGEECFCASVSEIQTSRRGCSVQPVWSLSDDEGRVCTAEPELEELEEVLDAAERPSWVREVAPAADHSSLLVQPSQVSTVDDEEDEVSTEGVSSLGVRDLPDGLLPSRRPQDAVQPGPNVEVQDHLAHQGASRPDSAELAELQPRASAGRRDETLTDDCDSDKENDEENRTAGYTKEEATKVDTAKVDTVKVDTTKVDTTKVDTAKVDMAKVDTTKVDTTKVDMAKVDMAKVVTAKVDTVKVGGGKPEVKLGSGIGPAPEESMDGVRRVWGYLVGLYYYQESWTVAVFIIGLGLVCLLVGSVSNYLRKSGRVRGAWNVGGLVALGLWWLWRQVRRFANGRGLDLFRLSRDPEVRRLTIVLTGGGRGIGRELALLLCRLKVKRVVVCMRSADARIKQFRSELSRLDLSRLDLGRTEVIGVEMDLRSRRSVLDACSRLTTLLAEKWTQEQRAEYTLGTQGQNHTLIDCLICNAGIATGDAIMTVNWLHHVVMIEQLRKHTRRVVCLSSIAHAIGRLPAQPALDVELIEGGTSWFGHELLRYASSKLAMLLEVQYLHQNGVEAYAVHPGWVATEMVNQLRFTCLFAKSVQYGAMTVAAVALKTNVIPGGYHETGRPIRTFPSAHGLAHGYRLLRQQALGMIDQDRSDRPRPV